MRTLLCIGIGTGNPEHVTIQAIGALNRVDVFFTMDKGPLTRDRTDLRREICDRYIDHENYRFLSVPDPARDRSASDYREAVEEWTDRRADVYEQVLRDEIAEDGCAGFLVWGDPSIYDSTLRIIERIASRGELDLQIEVIPGISSFQALAASHRISLTQVGKPVQITTGRLLAEGFPEDADDVVVYLDGDCSFRHLAPEGLDIFWGAYLGTEEEMVVTGPLVEVAEEIRSRRDHARRERGWIMDTYYLRRSAPPA